MILNFKRITLVLTAVLLVSSSTFVSALLINTHHDFTGAFGQDEMCKPCHTPHNADTTVANSPLWNHDVTNASFTVYTSATMNATPGQPSGTSKLCLSCHDGTVAVDSFGGAVGVTTICDDGGGTGGVYGNLPDDTLNSCFGTDMGDDHPISFLYNTALATTDGGLFDPSTTNSGLGGKIAEDMLSSGMLECTSCHDPHISRSNGTCFSGCHASLGGGPTLSLLKDGDLLCLTCHDK